MSSRTHPGCCLEGSGGVEWEYKSNSRGLGQTRTFACLPRVPASTLVGEPPPTRPVFQSPTYVSACSEVFLTKFSSSLIDFFCTLFSYLSQCLHIVLGDYFPYPLALLDSEALSFERGNSYFGGPSCYDLNFRIPTLNSYVES